MILLRTIAIGALALALAAPLVAHEAPEPIVVGESHTLTALDAERRVNVLLPPDYATSGRDYPLVVMLDGGRDQDLFLAYGLYRWNAMWQRSEPAIVVGIETVDRQRELLPATKDAVERERYATAGESTAFREWLAEEVLPMLREQYRDDGRAVLIGESAAGHFVAETWMKRPDLFTGYAAISPSLQWDGEALSRELAAMDAAARPPLYLSLADEGGATESGIIRFLGSAGGEVCFSDRRADLVHANTLHGLLPEALQYLLPTEADWLEEYGLTLRCTNAERGLGDNEGEPDAGGAGAD